MKNRVGFIVERHGDFVALKSRFKMHYQVVKTDGPQSHSMSITEIAARSRKQIQILKALDYRKVVVLVNFDSRGGRFNRFVEDIAKAFRDIDIEAEVNVSVPNRTIENWYLADIAYLSTQIIFLRDNLQQKDYEGQDGKEELRKLVKEDISYSEVDHGRKLFSKIRFDVASKNSASFKQFLSVAALK